MIHLTIDGKAVEMPASATVLEAAAAAGITIPTLCHRPGAEPLTSCLVCLVRINGGRRMVPACATRVAEGMSVESETPPVIEARKTALGLLLSDHAGDCIAPCRHVCPAKMDIPAMIRHVSRGDMHEALVVVKAHIPLPATLGRVCPELCENGCRRAKHDAAVSICQIKRVVGDTDLARGAWVPPCAPESGRRVAVVGAGPAGLSAAYYLRRLGHAVTILEAAEAPGGALRVHVGEEKLPRAVLDGEADVIRRMGVSFRFGTRLGQDITLGQLRDTFDAVVLACGPADACGPIGVPVAGRGLAVNRQTLRATPEGPGAPVFVAGAAVLPLKHAVRAVAAGHEAARAVDAMFRGHVHVVSPELYSVRLGALGTEEVGVLLRDASAAPRHGGTLAADAAAAEADRCLQCGCAKLDGCRLRQHAMAYGVDPRALAGERRPIERIAGELVVFEPGKCIACGQCVQIASEYREELGLTHIGRGFAVRIGVPFGGKADAALRKAAAACAAACPTAALVLRQNTYLPSARTETSAKEPG